MTPAALSALITLKNTYAFLQASGDLGDAPTDLLNAIDEGAAAACGLVAWLEEQQTPCMSRPEWTGESSLRRSAA